MDTEMRQLIGPGGPSKRSVNVCKRFFFKWAEDEVGSGQRGGGVQGQPVVLYGRGLSTTRARATTALAPARPRIVAPPQTQKRFRGLFCNDLTPPVRASCPPPTERPEP